MLKAKTVRLLNEAVEHILEEPKRFEMGDWGTTFSDDFISEYGDQYRTPIPTCNTQGCLAGWIVFLNKPRLWKSMLKEAKTTQTCDLDAGIPVAETAAHILGITDEQADSLFYVGGCNTLGWGKFGERFDSARTPKQRAKVLQARVKHFIKTDGVVETDNKEQSC